MPDIRITFVALPFVLLFAAPALAADSGDSGFEIGVRTGYAWSAGKLGEPPNGTNNDLGDYVSGQLPFWLDAGYRFNPNLYMGGYFQYGFGTVNDDRQDLCRNANVDCSASDVRLGVMGRYHFAPTWRVSPWAGFGLGYEWGAFALHQSVIGESNTDSSWSGFEIANLQAGADVHVASRVVLAPFISFSLGQFQSIKTTTRTGTITTTTEEDLASKSIHEWILIGVRAAFMP
jgi:opacity protein-like surface antigen